MLYKLVFSRLIQLSQCLRIKFASFSNLTVSYIALLALPRLNHGELGCTIMSFDDLTIIFLLLWPHLHKLHSFRYSHKFICWLSNHRDYQQHTISFALDTCTYHDALWIWIIQRLWKTKLQLLSFSKREGRTRVIGGSVPQSQQTSQAGRWRAGQIVEIRKSAKICLSMT